VKPKPEQRRVAWWLVVAGALALSAGAAARGPTAGDWLADCGAYLAVLEGAEGSDLDITYCTGLTLGILSGLDTGARIGAVSMASALTVLAELDQEAVLAVFRELGSEGLLHYCLPPATPISEVVTTVAAELQASPDKSGLPATALFFDALQSAYPCPDPEDEASTPGPEFDN
jgi:hypothetical protein